MGAQIEAREGASPPLTVTGAPPHRHRVRAAGRLGADQVVHPVRRPAAPRARRACASRRRAATTPSACSPQAGARVERDGDALTVHPQDELELDRIDVPGDPSSVAFHAAAAMLVPGSRIVLEGVAVNWTRIGFLRIAQRMGAVVVGPLEEPQARHPGDEPVAELDIADSPLGGTVVEADEVPLAIDELPLVALLGCFAEGETVVRGAEELRLKESDRIATVVDGLRGLGATHRGDRDGFAVTGTGGLRGGRWRPTATTGWRCSGPSPASPRARASRSWGWRRPPSPIPGLERRPPTGRLGTGASGF